MSRYRLCPDCGGRIDTTKKARPHVCDKEAILTKKNATNVRSFEARRAGIPDLNLERKKRRKPRKPSG